MVLLFLSLKQLHFKKHENKNQWLTAPKLVPELLFAQIVLSRSPKQCTGWRVRLAKAAQLQTVLSSYSPSEVDAFSSSCTRHWCWCLSAPQHSDLYSALHIKMDCFGSSFQFSVSHMPLHYSGCRAKLPKAARAYVLTWGSLV